MHILAALLFVTLMLHSGLQSSVEAIVKALRQGSLMARAIILNIVVVPLVALFLCRLFRVNAEVTTGILLMAIAPGVPFLPLSAGRAKGGHLALALGLVFVFGLISVVTAPLTANLILPEVERIRLPIGSFMMTLVLFQLVPLLAGLAIARANPRLAQTLSKVSGVLMLVSLVGLLAIILIPAARALAVIFGSGGIITIVLLVAISMLLGALAGGADRATRVTLSLGTGLRNPGLGALIATTNFAGTIVVPTVIAFLLLQVLISIPVGMYYKRELTRERQTGSAVTGDIHTPNEAVTKEVT
ncbi:MAG: bile acid:sodium symporter family protein [Vulcanimicrobiaceae bacterium]